MNSIDDQLSRLFRAAAKVQPTGEIVPPFGMETRVMTGWRSRAAKVDGWDMGLLVRGLAVACVIMVVSILPALTSTGAMASTGASDPFADFLQGTDSPVAADDAP